MIFKGLETDLFEQDGAINQKSLIYYINKHRKCVSDFKDKKELYEGDHSILKKVGRQGLANNKVVNNFAREIVVMASTYFLGKPINYVGQSIEPLKEALLEAHTEHQDTNLSKFLSIYGIAFELCYLDEGKPNVLALDPLNTFSVVSQGVKEDLLMSVHYYLQDSIYDERDIYIVSVYTLKGCYVYKVKDLNASIADEVSFTPNFTSVINLYPYKNNQELQGDFHQVQTLINAYNKTMSNSLDSIDDFVDSVLVLTGARLGNDPDEEDENFEKMVSWKLLELTEGSTANYLTKTLDQSTVSEMLNTLDQNIHKFSLVPCLSDQSFAGTQSGEALKYKLFGLDSICVFKEMLFTDGLKQRLRFFCDILALKGNSIDTQVVKFEFTRNLPENALFEAEKLGKLMNVLSTETALQKSPLVQDAEIELARIEEQRNKEAEREKMIQSAYSVDFT